MKHFCPVCGSDQLIQKAYNQEKVGSNEICPSCHFQFGITENKHPELGYKEIPSDMIEATWQIHRIKWLHTFEVVDGLLIANEQMLEKSTVFEQLSKLDVPLADFDIDWIYLEQHQPYIEEKLTKEAEKRLLQMNEYQKCPICGFAELDEAAYFDIISKGGGSFEICPCCDFQFGVTEDNEVTPLGYIITPVHMLEAAFQLYRMQWVRAGAMDSQWENKSIEQADLIRRFRRLGLDVENLNLGIEREVFE